MHIQQRDRKPSGIQADRAYAEKISDQQLYGNNHKGVKYNKIEYTGLNSYQTFLYNRTLFGLAVYTKNELNEMSPKKKRHILQTQKRAQHILNLWKQRIVNRYFDNFLEKYFPKSPITRHSKKTIDLTDPRYISRISFKKLGITKKQVIHKLIHEKILPSNYYELNTENVCR